MDDDPCPDYWTWSPDPVIQKEEFFNLLSQGRIKTNSYFGYRKWFLNDENNCQQKNVNSSVACGKENETMSTVLGRFLNKLKFWKKAQNCDIPLRNDNNCKKLVCRIKANRDGKHSLRTRTLRTCDDRPFSKIQNYEITIQNYNDCKQIVCRPKTDCDTRDSLPSIQFRTCGDWPSSGTVVIMLRAPNDENECQKENDCTQVMICQPDNTNCDAGKSIFSSIFNCKQIECQPNRDTRDSIPSIELRTCENGPSSSGTVVIMLRAPNDENGCQKENDCKQVTICQPDNTNCDTGKSIFSSIFNCKQIECQPNRDTRDSIPSIEFKTCKDPPFSEARTNTNDKCSGDENDTDKASLMQQLCECKEEIRKMRRAERVMLKKMKKANALLIRDEYIKFEPF